MATYFPFSMSHLWNPSLVTDSILSFISEIGLTMKAWSPYRRSNRMLTVKEQVSKALHISLCFRIVLIMTYNNLSQEMFAICILTAVTSSWNTVARMLSDFYTNTNGMESCQKIPLNPSTRRVLKLQCTNFAKRVLDNVERFMIFVNVRKGCI